MRHASLFSGIGGFDLAAHWMGWENVLHCEINPFCQRILKYYWPNAQSYHDIKKTDFTIHRGLVDVLSGGFPCQPYSTAGQRKGKEDERHLWPEMLRAIREIQPGWVVGENVRGLTNWNGGVVFDEVQADLENEGYQVTPFLLPACAVNAPHRRDRIWFIAYAGGNGHERRRLGEDRLAQGESEGFKNKRKRVWGNVGGISEQGIITDSDSAGRREGDQENEGRLSEQPDGGSFQYTTDTNGNGLQGRRGQENGKEAKGQTLEFNSRPTGNAWENFPFEPPICGGNDGVPGRLDGITFSKHRNESIKGYGNAIVPQVVLQIFQAIKQYEQLTK